MTCCVRAKGEGQGVGGWGGGVNGADRCHTCTVCLRVTGQDVLYQGTA